MSTDSSEMEMLQSQKNSWSKTTLQMWTRGRCRVKSMLMLSFTFGVQCFIWHWTQMQTFSNKQLKLFIELYLYISTPRSVQIYIHSVKAAYSIPSLHFQTLPFIYDQSRVFQIVIVCWYLGFHDIWVPALAEQMWAGLRPSWTTVALPLTRAFNLQPFTLRHQEWSGFLSSSN